MATIYNAVAARADRSVRALSGLTILSLAMDAGGKLFAPELMIANSASLPVAA